MNEIERFYKNLQTLLSLATLQDLKTSKRTQIIDTWFFEMELNRPPLNKGNNVTLSLQVKDKGSDTVIFLLQFWLWDYEVNSNYSVKNELTVYDYLFPYQFEKYSSPDGNGTNVHINTFKKTYCYNHTEKLFNYLQELTK